MTTDIPILIIDGRQFRMAQASVGYDVAIESGQWRAMRQLDASADLSGEVVYLLVRGPSEPLPMPRELTGRTLTLIPTGDHDDDEGSGTMRHRDLGAFIVRDFTVAFGEWRGSTVDVTGRGLCAPRSGPCRRASTLQLRGRLPFAGVTVDEGWRDKAETRLAQFFDGAQFDAPVKRADGAHVFHLRATP